MIIEVEDRFCKATKQFLNVLGRLQRAAASGDAVHEVAEAFVETCLRKLLEGKAGRVIGGIRQMATKRGLPKPQRKKVERKR